MSRWCDASFYYLLSSGLSSGLSPKAATFSIYFRVKPKFKSLMPRWHAIDEKEKSSELDFLWRLNHRLLGLQISFCLVPNATAGRLKAIGSPRNKFTKLFKCYNKWNVIEHSTAYCYKTTLTLLCILLQDNTNTTLQQQCWWRLAQWLIKNLNNVKLVSNKMKPSK